MTENPYMSKSMIFPNHHHFFFVTFSSLLHFKTFLFSAIAPVLHT